MKQKLFFGTLLIVCFAIGFSCKKTDHTQPTPTGTLMFYIYTNVDTTEVTTLGATYIMKTGERKISVNHAQLYISGIQLTKSDGSTLNMPNKIILQKQQVLSYKVATVPLGSYLSIKFNVGLSPTMNSTNPAAADSALNQPAMWFGSTAQPSGFVFVNFQGKIDTATAPNDTISQMQPFSYKIGTNANLKTVSMVIQNCSFFANQVQYIHMIIDYNKLFSGIQLNVNSNLNMNSANGGILDSIIANNIPLMFKYVP